MMSGEICGDGDVKKVGRVIRFIHVPALCIARAGLSSSLGSIEYQIHIMSCSNSESM